MQNRQGDGLPGSALSEESRDPRSHVYPTPGLGRVQICPCKPWLMFADAGLAFLHNYTTKYGPKVPDLKALKRLGDAVRAVAHLGGYRDRKGDPDPGSEIMWHGKTRLKGASLGREVGREAGFRVGRRCARRPGKQPVVVQNCTDAVSLAFPSQPTEAFRTGAEHLLNAAAENDGFALHNWSNRQEQSHSQTFSMGHLRGPSCQEKVQRTRKMIFTVLLVFSPRPLAARRL